MSEEQTAAGQDAEPAQAATEAGLVRDEAGRDAPGAGASDENPLADDAEGWQPLPPNARRLFMLSGLLVAVPAAIVGRLVSRIFDLPFGWSTSAVIALGGSALGAWLGRRRYLHTRWRLDADGFSLRKGRLWQSDIRVPINRVQHLDLRRGPLERRYRLSTLVIHTAGTRDSSVNVGGLAEDDAERLRDQLARQHEHDA